MTILEGILPLIGGFIGGFIGAVIARISNNKKQEIKLWKGKQMKQLTTKKIN